MEWEMLSVLETPTHNFRPKSINFIILDSKVTSERKTPYFVGGPGQKNKGHQNTPAP